MALDLSCGFSTSFNTDFKVQSAQNAMESMVYAYKDEPTYEKDMDLDEDGTITFDEFRRYCSENGISKERMKSMITKWSNWQLTKSKITYAKKGDARYDKEMDENKDDKVSYDEYIKYKNQQKDTNNSKEDENTSDNPNGYITCYG